MESESSVYRTYVEILASGNIIKNVKSVVVPNTEGQQFYSGEGLVLKGVEKTIRNYGYLGRVAMHETNDEIIRMMLGASRQV